MTEPDSVDAYINSFPESARLRLTQLRAMILATSPAVEESIRYGMPAYYVGQAPIAYFAGYKKHLNFFATPVGFGPVEEKLSEFHRGRASVRFPYNEPLPANLIQRILRFRLDLANVST